MRKSSEIRAQIAEKSAQVQAIVELATAENRELSSEEKTTVDAIQGLGEKPGEIANLQSDYERAVRFEARVKEISNGIGSTLGQPREFEQPSNLENIKVPARARSNRQLKAYDNSHDGERQAFIAGHVVLGGILGRQDSIEFLSNHGILNAMGTSDSLKGGFLVPEEMAAGVLRIRETTGVFPRFARPYPMGSDVTMVNRLIGDVTAYWVGESQEVTSSDAEIGQAKLVAGVLASLTKISKEIDQDAVVAIGDMITTSAGYAAALSIDNAGFNGTGTSTYGGVQGLATALSAAAIQDAIAGNVSALTLDIGDFEATVGKLPEYEGSNNRWYMNKTAYWNSARRLMDAAGGNSISDLGANTEPMFLGYPVTFTQAMSTGSAVSTIVAYFGDLGLAATVGTRRGIQFSVSNERYFETRQLGIMVEQRIAINIHERGDTVRTRPIVALKTAAS